MVVGVFLRNYKIYDGIKFVPISYGEKFTSYFGQNGIGKSSILESLDTFFNNREWNIFNRKSSGYMNDAYIVPLFLIKKTEISNKNKNLHSLLEKLSDFFWNAEDLKSSSSEMSFFLDFRKKLKEYLIDISQYFFFAVGIRNTNDKVPYFGVFQHIEGFLEKLDIEKSKLLLKNISDTLVESLTVGEFIDMVTLTQVDITGPKFIEQFKEFLQIVLNTAFGDNDGPQ